MIIKHSLGVSNFFDFIINNISTGKKVDIGTCYIGRLQHIPTVCNTWFESEMANKSFFSDRCTAVILRYCKKWEVGCVANSDGFCKAHVYTHTSPRLYTAGDWHNDRLAMVHNFSTKH